jgi:hypothetical protein
LLCDAVNCGNKTHTCRRRRHDNKSYVPGFDQKPNETHFIGCETASGRIHNIDGAVCKQWIDNRIFKGNLVSGKTRLVMPEAWLNEDSHHIEPARFPPKMVNDKVVIVTSNATNGNGRVVIRYPL